MKHPPSRFAAPPSLAFGGRGAHPAAWPSQFRGCPGMACSAAFGPGKAVVCHAMRLARSAMDN